MVQAGVIFGDPVEYGGEIYETVKIGYQTWFKSNLNYDVEGSRCYSNTPANCTTYGKLYDWATAMALSASCNTSSCASQVGTNHQGICPSGWHIPSDTEWTTLTNFVGGFSTAGTKLKANSPLWKSGKGTDIYGFSALPGSYGTSAGNFSNVGYEGQWWSATEYNAGHVYYRYMRHNYEYVGRGYYGEGSDLFSVRCVKD